MILDRYGNAAGLYGDVCPGCNAEFDPRVHTLWLCAAHGGGNPIEIEGSVLAGNTETDAATNRAWCDLIHRGIRPAAPLESRAPTTYTYGDGWA